MEKLEVWREFIFLVLIMFKAEASLPGNDPVKITFRIYIAQRNTLTCDHSVDKKHQNKYTVLEGQPFKIVAEYEKPIDHFICRAYTNNNVYFHYNSTFMKNEITFMAEKGMGTFWECTLLTFQNIPILKPVVYYKNATYAAAHCFMKIHVRQKEPPQTMLVNNMMLAAVREELSEKDVDFMTEYQYADGDVVNVTCANFLTKTPLTMEYEMAGITSDINIMRNISSSKMIGFVTKLHSGHNNSYMMCINTETTDYTKVMMRFVMRTKLNIISITINGMILRPPVTAGNSYIFDCKFDAFRLINVKIEVVQTDVKLQFNHDLIKFDTKNTEVTPKKTEIRFYLNPRDDKLLVYSALYYTGGPAESLYIRFTTANFPVDHYPSVHIELPSSGTVMELYSYGRYKRTVVLYEFKQDDTLQLTCGPLSLHGDLGPIIYLELDNTEKCQFHNCNVSKTLQLATRKYRPIVCYLKEAQDPDLSLSAMDIVGKEIRVILLERVLATEPCSALNTTADLLSSKACKVSSYSSTLVYSLLAFGGVIIILIWLVNSYICIKKICCVRPKPPKPTPRVDPASVYYENLLSVFEPINEREAAEQQKNIYEEIRAH